jgi:RNA polymerase sigma factor (sigma-70 family)
MKESLVKSVKEFQSGKITRRDFLKEASDFILKIPSYLGYHEDDIKNEFFAFVFSRIDKIISRYKELESSSFETWFKFVLKRQFHAFLRETYPDKVNEVNCDNNYIESIVEDRIEEKSLKLDLSFLSKKEREVVNLKYGITAENDFNLAAKKILEKLDQKRKLEDRISEKYIRLLKIRSLILNEHEPCRLNDLKNREKKVLKTKRNLEFKANTFYLFPTNEWIGEQLGITEGTVASYLNRIKIKMKVVGLENIMPDYYY